MTNTGPPIESPLKAWVETPLRALQTIQKFYPKTVHLGWFNNFATTANGGGANGSGFAIANTGVTCAFYPAEPPGFLHYDIGTGFSGSPIIGFLPNQPPKRISEGLVFGSPATLDCYLGSSIRTEYPMLGPGFDWTAVGFAIPGMPAAFGFPPDPNLFNPVFTIIYPIINPDIPFGQNRIDISMNTPPAASNATGTFFALKSDGTQVKITDFDWITGFHSLNGRGGRLFLPIGSWLKVVIQNLDFGTVPASPPLPPVPGITYNDMTITFG